MQSQPPTDPEPEPGPKPWVPQYYPRLNDDLLFRDYGKPPLDPRKPRWTRYLLLAAVVLLVVIVLLVWGATRSLF